MLWLDFSVCVSLAMNQSNHMIRENNSSSLELKKRLSTKKRKRGGDIKQR
jgi:hypothetical protein